MKCNLCENEAQFFRNLGGIARRYNPNKYCKECYEKLTKPLSDKEKEYLEYAKTRERKE